MVTWLFLQACWILPLSNAYRQRECLASHEQCTTFSEADALLRPSSLLQGVAFSQRQRISAVEDISSEVPPASHENQPSQQIKPSTNQQPPPSHDASKTWWGRLEDWALQVAHEASKMSTHFRKEKLNAVFIQMRHPDALPTIVGGCTLFFVCVVFLCIVLLHHNNEQAAYPETDHRRWDQAASPDKPLPGRMQSAFPPEHVPEEYTAQTQTLDRPRPRNSGDEGSFITNDALTVEGKRQYANTPLVGAGEHRDGSPKPAPLSPQLVVPEDCECALVLPAPGRGWTGSFGIADTRGSTVLSASLQGPGPTSPEFIIKLSSASAPCTTVAQCRKVKDGIGYSIYRGDTHELFATFKYWSPGRARLVLAGGNLAPGFDFATERGESSGPPCVTIRDENALHAVSEPYELEQDASSAFRSEHRNLTLVRVGPLGDVGLVLCGLLCLQQLQ